MNFSTHNLPYEQELNHDQFELMLRRQGWHLIRYKSMYTDSRVIRLRGTSYENGHPSGRQAAFYQAFGDNTFRKILRHVFFHRSCTLVDLKRICSSEPKLKKYLDFMTEHQLLLYDGTCWHKNPYYQHIDNLGPTLEWYVAEWFRTWLQVPARHGVALKDVADGGDLDVVAFVDGIRVMVECKSGSPSKITSADLQLFLHRAADFNPEIAVLLIDTESKIEQQIAMLNRLRTEGGALTAQDSHRSLYWGARHIYAINSRVSIADSLSSVLRLYYSKIRHLSF
ncbi:hypothetical protein EI42_02544 [Thermosporothrix hazakensis]|uniref:Uncharacterized protein n=2 Tax=Thermosporothrix TaxID=768650 RepID=A0A326U961_THEHA|nr:hypothetical protein [Thermosporothrix hazakensis]PZW30572.1 hypothetical protein EI42_02544 [Thermosporothrix hazakensis]BBH91287.1 hypothetical protein KTC_60380 [Thermosporothrix sp. COM3]GCE49434.1 hypothetical protein KTH_43030 [Thermosporothrix hazakensis]